MTAAGRILGLQHVALPFPGTPGSLAEARHFYGQLLRLEERPVPAEFGASVLWFAIGEQELHLFAEPSGVAANSASRRHPCLQVKDLAALRVTLEESGLETISGDPILPGRPRFFVVDPFGNAVEFVEITPTRVAQASS